MSPLEIVLYSVIGLAVGIYITTVIVKAIKQRKNKTGENKNETRNNAEDM